MDFEALALVGRFEDVREVIDGVLVLAEQCHLSPVTSMTSVLTQPRTLGAEPTRLRQAFEAEPGRGPGEKN